jgi:hypothetical protein
MDKNELPTKIRQSREMSFVKGNCYWYGYLILDNADGVTSLLKTEIHRAKALLPAYTHMFDRKPKKVKNLKEIYTEDMHFLAWDRENDPTNPEKAKNYVVYRFRDGEKVDICRAENIVKVTPDNFYLFPYEGGKKKYTYVVTALDAFNNESGAKKIKIKL